VCYGYKKRGKKGINIFMRPLCRCGQRPRAVNYKKNNKTYYRSLCEICMTNGLYHGVPRWYRAGYRVKTQCEKCGFKSIHKEVFRVFHVDGNLDNCRATNLKTICCNCAQVLSKDGIRWVQGDLVADY
jgi:superfamily II helicase